MLMTGKRGDQATRFDVIGRRQKRPQISGRSAQVRAAWAVLGAIVGSIGGVVVGILFFGFLGLAGGFIVGIAFSQGGGNGALTGGYYGTAVGIGWGILLGGVWGFLFGMTLGADRVRRS